MSSLTTSLAMPVLSLGWGKTLRKACCRSGTNAILHCSGVLASLARLGYQIPEAKKPNQTIIVMILSELKYVPFLSTSFPLCTHADEAAPYSIVEHMIGLIVSSMPSLPAFVRHLQGVPSSTSISFDPLSQRGLKKKSETSVL